MNKLSTAVITRSRFLNAKQKNTPGNKMNIFIYRAVWKVYVKTIEISRVNKSICNVLSLFEILERASEKTDACFSKRHLFRCACIAKIAVMSDLSTSWTHISVWPQDFAICSWWWKNSTKSHNAILKIFDHFLRLTNWQQKPSSCKSAASWFAGCIAVGFALHRRKLTSWWFFVK